MVSFYPHAPLTSSVMRPLKLFLLVVLASSAPPIAAQETSSISLDAPFYVPRLDQPIHLDGRVDEEAWDAVPILPMVTNWPSFGQPPSERTEIRIAYDDTYLYVAGRCFDDPELIQASTFKRDKGGMMVDMVGLGLDTFTDNENLLAFIVTPTGSRVDLHLTNDAQGPINASWDTFWDAATERHDWGWSIEMRIPFSSLRFQEHNGQVIMGLILYRYIPHKVELDVFPDPTRGGHGLIPSSAISIRWFYGTESWRE